MLKPYLFLSFYLSLSYPISLTIGKLGVDNLGILFLTVCSALSLLLIIKRSDFSFNKERVALFASFLPIIAVVVASSLYGFIRSGNDSLEILVKFFVFGVFPSLLVMLIPFRKDVFVQILDLTYYIVLTIFAGFSIGYFFFKLFNPSAFIKFFTEFDNPIGTSLFMMQFVLVSAIYLILNRDTSRARKNFIYGTILTALFFVVSTFQRSFLIAIVAAVIYYIISTYKIGLRMVLTIALSAILFGAVFYNITLIVKPESINKVEKTIEFAEKLSENKDIMRVKEAEGLGSIGYRIIKIIASIKKIKESPYFGNGLGTFSNFAGYKYPHNIFIEFLYSSGFTGFIVSMFFLGYIFFKIQININRILNLKIKAVLKLSFSFAVFCLTVLQFTGGVMNIFPYLVFLLFVLFSASSKQEMKRDST
ncbi:MAG: O-antigen ligase family protein [bacterium]